MKLLLKQSLLVCIATIGIFASSCGIAQTRTSSEDQLSQHDSDSLYSCSMHPEVTGKKGDKCVKCGMELQLAENSSSETIEVNITSMTDEIGAGQETEFTIDILKNNQNVALDVVHEKKIHMLVVDAELAWFDHIHPVELSNGRYGIKESFPHSGKYYMYLDVKPNGSEGIVHKQVIEVNGEVNPQTETDKTKWVSEIDGYTVTVINGSDFQTNRPQHIGIRIEKDGKNISADDIQPYLGAQAHIVIISKEDKDILHVHPTSNVHVPIHGETYFDKPGLYRMWVQFQQGGSVHTADFTVEVKEGQEQGQKSHHNHH